MGRPIAPLALAVAIALAGPATAGDRGFRGFKVAAGERVLGEEDAGRLFVPGSVQKLLVATAALHHLGGEYRVRTVVRAAGRLEGGVLHGDLVLVAAGDPTWNARFYPDDPRAPLRQLARRLRARGLERVEGDLVVDLGRFPGRSHPPSRPLAELVYAWAAPAVALAVDETVLEVEIRPGARPGDPGGLRPLDTAARSLRFAVDVRTVSAARHDRGTVDFLPLPGERAVRVTGEYPVSEPPYVVELADPIPELWAAEALRQVLAEEGITVAGTTRLSVDTAAGAARGEVLAEHDSPPLSAILPEVLADSRNWYAEMLLRLLGAEVLGEGRYDDALDLVADFLTGEVGIAENAFVLDDASGLSPYDLLAPEAVTDLLRWAWRQPWRDVFLASLAAPGRGTLRFWGALPEVAAKTGTVRASLAIAGYLEPARHAARGTEAPVFACFLNHRGAEERAALRAEMVAWLRRWARAASPPPSPPSPRR